MKLLVTSDWQCCLSNLSHCEVVVEHILELIPKHKIDAVVILGDVKEAFNPVDVRVMNFLSNAVERIRDSAVVHVMLGNHDRTTTRDESPSCLPLLETAGAFIHEQAEAVALSSKVDAYFIPFMRDKEKLRQHLFWKQPGERTTKKLLFFHEEIEGCCLNVKVNSHDGIAMQDLRPDCYDLCIGGHIHLQQQLRNNVWYVGSPFCQDWGEVNQPKGFLLIDTDDNCSVTRISSRIPGWYDPTMPGFPKDRNNWQEAQIRIHPQGTPTQIEKARTQAATKYKGATIHIQPPKSEDEPLVETPLGDTDLELLENYLKQTVEAKQVGSMLAYLSTRVDGKFKVGIKGFKIERVHATETLCFKECTLDLTNPGLTLVTGLNKDWRNNSNGAGKSTFLSLPQVAFFGSTLKGQTHDALRRKDAVQPMVISLQGISANGGHVQIDRGRKPGLLKVSVDGRDESMGDPNATQKKIEEITGLTQDVFTNSIYIGQAEVSTLLYGTDKQKKELFSRFMGLERFIKAQDRVRKDIRNCSDKLNATQHEVNIAEAMIAEQSRALEDITIQAPVKKVLPKPELNKIKQLTKEIGDTNAWFDQNQKAFEGYLDTGLKAEARIEQLQKWLDKMGVEGKGNCPLCGSHMKDCEKHEREMRAEITKLEVLYSVAEWNKSSNRDLRDKKFALFHTKQRECSELQRLAREYDAQEELWKQTQEAYQHIVQVQEACRVRIKLLESRAIDHKNYVADLEENLNFLQACLRVVSREGLPTYLCATVCPRLNTVSRRYSDLFTDGEIGVEFQIEAGDLNLDIINNHGGKGVYDQSLGELRLACLIGMFAFREVMVPVPLLILDEPGEGLDAVNSVVFAKGLKEVARTFGHVFLTTHNNNIISVLEPDRHLEIVKKGGISTVVEVI